MIAIMTMLCLLWKLFFSLPNYYLPCLTAPVTTYVYVDMTPSLQHKERISIDKNTRVFSICHNTMRIVKVLWLILTIYNIFNQYQTPFLSCTVHHLEAPSKWLSVHEKSTNVCLEYMSYVYVFCKSWSQPWLCYAFFGSFLFPFSVLTKTPVFSPSVTIQWEMSKYYDLS